MMSPWGLIHEETRRRKWELGENIAPTTWGANWYYYSAADCCCHTLYSCPCWLQEVLIITIPPFQVSCPHELDQNFQLSYHVHSHYLFARAYDNLILVVDGDEVRFMRWSSLEHMDLISVSCCFRVMFLFQECRCHFFPKCGIVFSSRSEGLIVWWWSEYSGLWWCLYEFHVLE